MTISSNALFRLLTVGSAVVDALDNSEAEAVRRLPGGAALIAAINKLDQVLDRIQQNEEEPTTTPDEQLWLDAVFNDAMTPPASEP